MHGTLRLFPVFISPIVWNMCEHLHYESVYFKELHRSKNTIYRAGAAVVSTITSYIISALLSVFSWRVYLGNVICCTLGLGRDICPYHWNKILERRLLS